jgi:hypothetical protein
MRKPMEFPTEWTLPDPAEDLDLSVNEETEAPPEPQAAVPEEQETTLAAGAASRG